MLLRRVISKLNQISLRGKILVAFLVIMALFLYRVSFSTKYYIVEKYGQEQVTSVLQGAHNYFYGQQENMVNFLRTIVKDMEYHELDMAEMTKKLKSSQNWPEESRPDILFVTDLKGNVIYSKNNPTLSTGDYSLQCLKKAINQGSVCGIEVLGKEFLRAEELAQKAEVQVIPTPQATNVDYEKELRAMSLVAVEPLHKSGDIIGYLVIGKVLNGNSYLVDNIRSNFNVRATIFLDKVRIATNVTDDNGERAIGTLLSDPVYDTVINKGENYFGRAFVVNDWYITAYEPIRDINGRVVGALYVGALEAPLLEIQRSVNNEIRGTLALAVAIFSIAILWIYALVIKPIHEVSKGVLHIAKGDFRTRFSVSHPNKCWEILGCNQTKCRAYGNALIRCWLLPDTWCRHQGDEVNNADTCSKCDVYNIYSGTELDRLTDAVNYMAMSIDEKTTTLENMNQELEDKNRELLEHKDELESQKENLISLNNRLEESMKALDDSQNIIYALAVAVEAKDPYTRGHSERVAEYSIRLAKKLGLTGHELQVLKGAALLHDIGKIGISGNILRKPGALNALEFQQVRKHPGIGERICLSLKFAQEMLPIIRHHHEHYNGQGYPDGLKGEHIPRLARIIAIADAYDAMTSDRPYRSGLGKEEALRRLKEGAGTQWDPHLIPVFVELVKDDPLQEVAASKEQEHFLD